jgi:hypothetical protein
MKAIAAALRIPADAHVLLSGCSAGAQVGAFVSDTNRTELTK